jgi:hypothetical protein
MQTSTDNACSMPLSESDLLSALTSYGGEQAKFVARNPKLFKTTFDLLKAVQSANLMAGTSAVLGGISAGSKAMNANKALQTGARATSFTVSTFKSTLDLTKVFSLTSTGAVLVYVGATTIQKTGMAVSLAGGDSERAQCVGALMELGGSTAVAAASAPTGILLALTLASLTASVVNASYACKWIEAP